MHYKNKLAFFSCIFGLTFSTLAFTDSLNQAIDTELQTNKAAAQSQTKIDKISDQSRQMLDQYRHTLREIETLGTYNTHLAELVVSQDEEKTNLEKQLREIEVTQREIVPLMLRMLDNLDTFIQLDSPFLPSERRKRVDLLKSMMKRSDVTDAEKYRRVLEAYQIENDYGHTIEAYRADLQMNGSSRPVDFLRFGRIALFYQTLNGNETGVWNKKEKKWEVLQSSYQHAVRKGLRIARKEAAPDLLTLPIPAPETVQ